MKKLSKKAPATGVAVNGDSLKAGHPTAAALPAYEHKRVKHGEIRPDPDQPRKVFAEGALNELAESIRLQGILQPLILESVPAKYTIREPDLHSGGNWTLWNNETKQEDFQGNENHCYLHVGGPDSQDLKAYHRIVCGERRWRAAELAGLAELPANVYPPLTKEQRFALQWIENEQRVNITALEEAEALAKQLTDRKQADASFSPEKLAAEVGLSRAGIYEKLKLTRLHAPVREALLAGKISTSVAGVVAIVPLPNQQEALLKRITNENDYYFPFSVRDVQQIVDDDYCKQLSEAPFDLEEEMDCPAEKFPEEQRIPAHANLIRACMDCPHRSGNLAEQFPELAKRPNVCTQPDCFALKCKAHWLAQAENARAKGKVVMTEKEFKAVKSDYVEADRPGYLFQDRYAAKPSEVLGKHAPEPVLVSTAEGLKEVYAVTDLPAACKAAKVKLAADAKPKTAEEEAKEAEKEKAAAEKRALRLAVVEEQLPALAKLLPKVKDAVAWEICELLGSNGSGYTDHEWLTALAGKQGGKVFVLARFFADEEMRPCGHYDEDWDPDVLKAWLLAGVDLKACLKEAEKAAQAKLALPPPPAERRSRES